MKKFQCGDVVPGCKKVFVYESEDEILSAVAVHAREDHNLQEVPPALIQQVRDHIQDAHSA